MKRLIFIGVLVACIAGMPAAAQPVINAGGIVNVASYAYPGLPNGGIAQGSIFAIYGSGMGPAKGIQVSSFPLSTDNFQGTSVAVTVNGTVTKCAVLFTAAGQVNVLLPSATPVGSGAATVTYNGQTSAPAPIQVVANSFGIFAVNAAGSGQGVFTNGSNQANEPTFAAHPGDILNVWGTGLGAVQGDDTAGPLPGNLNTSLKVYIGGVQAAVGYRGRSGCCAGVDQIQITVPANLTGCALPAAVQIGDVVSNFVTMSVAETGSTCSDPAGSTGSLFSQFLGQSSASLGFVNLIRSSTVVTLPPPIGNGMPTTEITDFADASFTKYQIQGLNLGALPLQVLNFGACSVYIFTGSSATPSDVGTSTGLDAGSAITVSGPAPDGPVQLKELGGEVGTYTAELGSNATGGTAGPLYLSPGSYTITGPGGKDVGPFSVTIQVPQPLTWTNQSSFTVVQRSAGATVTWTGADPSGTVSISGYSLAGTDTSNLFGAFFSCIAKASDDQFTVPAIVLLSLPPSATIQVGGVSFPTGSLGVSSATQPVKFTASGLDLGFATSEVTIGQPVTYQ